MRVLGGLVYMTKSSGPNTEPWVHRRRMCTRTGRFHTWHGSNEMTDMTWGTRWKQGHGYQIRMIHVIKISWSIVSKAAERSSRQRHDTFCDPIALPTWSWMYKRAASVEWLFAVGWQAFQYFYCRDILPMLMLTILEKRHDGEIKFRVRQTCGWMTSACLGE